MSWSFHHIGTPVGVQNKLAKDAIAYPSCYPKQLVDFINASIDAVSKESGRNGVSVKSSGHGGSVSELVIQSQDIVLDPEPTR